MQRHRRLLLIGGLSLLLTPPESIAREDAQAPSRRPEIWAVVIGVGDHIDPMIPDSPGVAEQSDAVLQWFRDAGWDHDHAIMLRDFGSRDPGTPNRPAPSILPSRANLDWAVERWLAPRARQGDLVLFYFAGRSTAVVTRTNPRAEPRTDYYLLPSDAGAGNAAATGWSLDRAVDELARRRIRVVCWLATAAPTRSQHPAAPAAVSDRAASIASMGQDWLRGLARWPGVTAWLAADHSTGIGEASGLAAEFTGALISGLGTPDRKQDLAACLRELQRNPGLKLRGFRALGGVPPRLSLWADEFVRPTRPSRPEMVLQVGHADKITALTSTADGTTLFSAAMDSTVRAWSFADRSLTRVLTGHMVGATALSLSDDDRWLVSGGGRGAILAYDLRDFSAVPSPNQPHTNPVVQVQFLPDRTHLATIDRSGAAYLWDLSVAPLEPKPLLEVGGGKGVTCLELASGGRPRGGILAVRRGDGRVHVLDARGGGEKPVEIPPGRPTCLAVSPDGRRLAVGLAEGRVAVVDFDPRGVLERPIPGRPARLAFATPGRLIVGHARGVRLIDLRSNAATDLLDRPATTLAVSPDGTTLAVTEPRGLKAWRLVLEGGPPRLILDEPSVLATSLSFTADGRSLLIGHLDGSLAARPLEPAEPVARAWAMPARRGKIQRLDGSKDRRDILVIDELGRAQVWGLADRACLGLPGRWASGGFLADGTVVLAPTVEDPRSGGPPVMVRRGRDGIPARIDQAFFRDASPNGRFHVPPLAGFELLAIAPDGSRVAASASAAQLPLVCVWDAKSGRLTHWIERLDDPVRSMSFSADARLIATAGDSSQAALWDLSASEGRLETSVARISDPSSAQITCVAIRPGHDQLVTGHSDGTARLWSWQGSKVKLEAPQLILGAFSGAVKALAFTPDSLKLAACGDGTSIWLGALDPRPAPLEDLNLLRPHHDEQIGALFAWPGSSLLVSGSDDASVKFWDLGRKALWGTFSLASRGDAARSGEPGTDALPPDLDWVFYTPEGLFDATREGTGLVRFRQAGQPRRLEQFEATHFRFGLGQDLRDGKAPHVTGEAEQAPPITIAAPARPDSSIPQTELTLSLGSTDLKDIRLYHNDRPIPTGLDPRKPPPSRFPVPVTLLKGRNRFYAMASRDGAYDSRSDEVEVAYDGPLEAGQVHVVALGVGDYRRRRLGYAGRDADRLSEVLHRRGLDTAGKAGIRTVLTDAQVNRRNVEKAFDDLARKVEDRPQDTVVVFLAGHTGVFEQEQFCLLLPSFPFAADEPVQARARDVATRKPTAEPIDPDRVLPYSVIAVNLTRLRALNRLVIVDACQAEAILQDPEVAEIQKWMEIGTRRARTSYLMAARRGEPALEVDPLRHGLFTYTLLHGLGAIAPDADPEEVVPLKLRSDADFNGDGILSTGELEAYTRRYLPELTRVFPGMVARREARVATRGPTVHAPLEQRERIQTADISFPLVPLERSATGASSP